MVLYSDFKNDSLSGLSPQQQLYNLNDNNFLMALTDF
ncbi:hypothetical protein Ga0123461_2344 [Mariprofundus aestuarium]|uniref:Uncharacterized protein n=1 Tax=Mariprofundus aestuarium TaxID=1921086 RepID=A0A2K8L0B8_MARES|nr:hypothetical protein Ga0123461_2344 [Mariprofundus aestuarium]